MLRVLLIVLFTLCLSAQVKHVVINSTYRIDLDNETVEREKFVMRDFNPEQKAVIFDDCEYLCGQLEQEMENVFDLPTSNGEPVRCLGATCLCYSLSYEDLPLKPGRSLDELTCEMPARFEHVGGYEKYPAGYRVVKRNIEVRRLWIQ